MNEEIKHPDPEMETTEVDTEENVVELKAEEEEIVEETIEKTWDDPSNMEEALKMIAELHLKLRDAETELGKQQDLRLRLQADFDNFRKRKNKEMSDSIRFANQDLLLQLIPVLDNFDRTLDAIEKTDNLSAVKDGIAVVDKSMKKTFKKIGMEPINSIGKELNPEFHEVITTIPVEEKKKKGVVIDEIEKGYKLKDRVIRVAKVVIGE